ncbi:hypothetical protein AAHE18_18G091200 [Arachis hypogaea]
MSKKEKRVKGDIYSAKTSMDNGHGHHYSLCLGFGPPGETLSPKEIRVFICFARSNLRLCKRRCPSRFLASRLINMVEIINIRITHNLKTRPLFVFAMHATMMIICILLCDQEVIYEFEMGNAQFRV